MSVPLIHLRESAILTGAFQSPAGLMDGFNTLLNNEKAAHPADWKWEVAYKSATELIIRPRDSLDTRRLILFGGSGAVHVNARAVPGSFMTASTGGLYAGVSNSGDNAPVMDYTLGAPLSGNYGCIGWMAASGYAGPLDRIHYYEHEDGIILHAYNSGVSAVNGCHLIILGKFLVAPDKETLLEIASSSNIATANSTPTWSPDINNLAYQTTVSMGIDCQDAFNGFKSYVAIWHQNTIQRIFRSLLLASETALGATDALTDQSSTLKEFVSIPMFDPDIDLYVGNLRQIAMGPRAIQGQSVSSSLTGQVAARAIGPNGANLRGVLWLTEFETLP